MSDYWKQQPQVIPVEIRMVEGKYSLQINGVEFAHLVMADTLSLQLPELGFPDYGPQLTLTLAPGSFTLDAEPEMLKSLYEWDKVGAYIPELSAGAEDE